MSRGYFRMFWNFPFILEDSTQKLYSGDVANVQLEGLPGV